MKRIPCALLVFVSAACASCSLLVSTGDLTGGAPPPSAEASAPTSDGGNASGIDGADGDAGGGGDAAGGDGAHAVAPVHLLDAESATSSAGSTITATFAAPIREGNTLVCFTFSNAGDAKVTSLTDSAGDALVRVEGPLSFAGYAQELWYAASTKASERLEVTVETDKPGVRRGVSCHEYEGSLTIAATRAEVFTGGGAKSSAPIELSAPKTTGIVFAFWGGFSAVTVSPGWTQRSTIDGDYLGDRVIRAGTPIAIEANCKADCVMLGAAFVR